MTKLYVLALLLRRDLCPSVDLAFGPSGLFLGIGALSFDFPRTLLFKFLLLFPICFVYAWLSDVVVGDVSHRHAD